MLRGKAVVSVQAGTRSVREKWPLNLDSQYNSAYVALNAPIHFSVQVKHCTEYNVVGFVKRTRSRIFEAR